MTIFIQLILLSIGFAMLSKGSDWFVDGACDISRRFHIPQLVVGLTIVAMGTSAPEAAVSITSAFKGVADITIGNIIGSNIMNILVILGLAAAIVPITVAKSTVRIEIPFLLAITVLLGVLGMDGTITFGDALILVGGFCLYLGYLLYCAKHPDPHCAAEAEEPAKELKLWQAIAALVVGMGLIIWGSDVAVDAATQIALTLGISERIIGLTIVAFGTSLPELFTSVTAARKGNADIAIGNIVGSNIFNILFVVGLSGLITPVPFSAGFRADMVAAICAVVLLWIASLPKRKLIRPVGILMLAAYAGYLLSVL